MIVTAQHVRRDAGRQSWKASYVLAASLWGLALPACGQQPSERAADTPPAVSQSTPPRTLDVSIAEGGSVVTDLGYGVQVNKGSSLQRRFVTINDPSAPVALQNVGIRTTFASDRYDFQASGALLPSEPIQAVEIRIVLFDMFGGRMKTLSATHVADLSAQSAVIESWGKRTHNIGTRLALQRQASGR
jgi:hypothetical protein